ncbi:hypothetical protein AB3662_27195 [Sorangium cellulosum]|uniref:hypothetical protein n=1 Tax=Sorangium cellulosum TaxID=56 RepID=UPI003D9AAC65
MDVINSWNGQIGHSLNARIEPVRWESHARPEMGQPAQDVINQQLVDGCDFGIAIFWSRLGSPTAKHPSGSVEEVDRLLQKGSKVMVYFSAAPIPQQALKDDQFARLQSIRERYQKEGLLATFETIEKLREMLALHVTSLMSEMLLNARASGQPIPSTGTVTAPQPDIRVKVSAGLAASPMGDTVPIIAITAENHSPSKFFLSTFLLELDDGTHLVFQRDKITGEFQQSRVIEPGDSFAVHIDPDEGASQYKGKKIVAAIVNDKIGRVFRSTPKDMSDALHNLAGFKKKKKR